MIKLIFEGEDIHKMMAYTVIGQLGQRIPSVIDKNSNLLCHLFDTLVSVCRINNRKKKIVNLHICLLKYITKMFIFFFNFIFKTEGDLRRTIRDTLISITSAFILNKDDEANISLMNGLLSTYIESSESNVRHVYISYY